MPIDIALVDRTRFLGPEYLDEVLAKGFDAGASFLDPDTRRYDEDAVSRMIEDLADEYGYDPEDEDEAPMRAALATWIPSRVEYVARSLAERETAEDGSIPCTRVLCVDRETAEEIVAGRVWAGEFWSAGGDAQPYWAERDEDGEEALPHLVLEARIPASSVDWDTTFARNMNYLVGDDEIEISMIRDAPIEVFEAEYAGETMVVPSAAGRGIPSP